MYKDKNVKVGDLVRAITNMGTLTGIISGTAQYFEGEVKFVYQICLGKHTCVNISSDDIEELYVYEQDKEEIIDILSSKYGVDCFSDGSEKDGMTLVCELIKTDKWSKMSRDEKALLIDVFQDIDSRAIDEWDKSYHSLTDKTNREALGIIAAIGGVGYGLGALAELICNQ